MLEELLRKLSSCMHQAQTVTMSKYVCRVYVRDGVVYVRAYTMDNVIWVVRITETTITRDGWRPCVWTAPVFNHPYPGDVDEILRIVNRVLLR